MHSGLRNLFSTQREAGPSIWVILEDLVTAHNTLVRSLYIEEAVHTEKDRSNPRQVHKFRPPHSLKAVTTFAQAWTSRSGYSPFLTSIEDLFHPFEDSDASPKV